MKQCFVSTLNKNYVLGLKIMLKSILKHNPNIDIPYVIFNEGDIDHHDIKDLKTVYNNIVLKQIDTTKYQGLIFSGARKWHINPGNRLEIFTLSDFDKIIFLDVDMLSRGSLKDILECTAEFSACYHPMIREEVPAIGFEDGFNCGIMIISKKFLNYNYLKKALQTIKKFNWLGNQATFNILFKPHLTLLPQKYFITTCYLDKEKLNSAVFLHFVGEKKPWLNTSLELKENYDSFILNEDAGNSCVEKYLALKSALREYKAYL